MHGNVVPIYMKLDRFFSEPQLFLCVTPRAVTRPWGLGRLIRASMDKDKQVRERSRVVFMSVSGMSNVTGVIGGKWATT